MSKTAQKSKNLATFSLTRLRKGCYIAPVSVDFSPVASVQHRQHSILPHFNQDCRFYTPAFVNPYEQFRLQAPSESYLQNEKEKFLRKVSGAESSSANQTVFFNPRDDLYCSMCKVGFEHYWEHINSKSHILKIKSSKANTYIHQICNSYRKRHQDTPATPHLNASPCSKKKKISKNANRPRRPSKEETYAPEDFIIRFPKELIENEQNMSTHGVSSLKIKP